jgi:polyphosphate kinase 2 (PPK2 family)
MWVQATTRDLPERGPIGIFNRSYYEEVLIARVHPEILRSEGLPDAPHDEKTIWHVDIVRSRI